MLLALGAATFAGGFALRRHGGVAHGGARRAVLFDQIAADDPRTDFRADIARSLAAAGVALRVVPPEEATVARFQDLPADRARLVVVRAHAALVLEGGAWTEDVALFTSDPVDLSRFEVTGLDAVATALPYEDQRGAAPVEPSPAARAPAPTPAPALALAPEALAALVPVRRRVGADRRPFLGIGAHFVRDHLHGRFDPDAVIVLMGCDTLRGRALSAAFLGRGAAAVVGWSDEVSAGHSDRATAALVADLAAGASVTEALRAASRAVGPDPVSGAHLVADLR